MLLRDPFPLANIYLCYGGDGYLYRINRWECRLTRRDADEAEAARALTHSRVPWPRPRTVIGVSPHPDPLPRGGLPRRYAPRNDIFIHRGRPPGR